METGCFDGRSILRTQNPIGVMQGRLLPKYKGRYQSHPFGYWQDEFPKAAALDLDCIEFILDFNDAEFNPLLRDDGPDEILLLSEKTGVKVVTVCADYFMEAPLHHTDTGIAAQSQNVLRRLLSNGNKLGLTDIVIPCVDQSSLTDDTAKERFIARLRPLEEAAVMSGISLSLETDLAPQPFADLLEEFGSNRVTVNYDTGNSAALCYDPVEELSCYGNKITDIHIKDRKHGGGSVPLGNGDVQFCHFFKALRSLNYVGPFIMQAYRDDEGLTIFNKQLAWMREHLAKYVREDAL
jgi:sugar phosphate isomerase/epimerase